MTNNELQTDFKRAYLGFFDCNLSIKNVEEIKSDFALSFIRKRCLEPNVRLFNSTFGRELYWNYDNLGSLIVPQKG
ncbi:MAG: hypothetical protein HC831_11595 [Chloroflexia bacterium]|nr:hypothetical protein [Chloroflexia bacterium]